MMRVWKTNALLIAVKQMLAMLLGALAVPHDQLTHSIAMAKQMLVTTEWPLKDLIADDLLNLHAAECIHAIV
jgi:hypothetical protein